MSEHEGLEIGGAPVVTLERPRPRDADRPTFLSAQVLPGRGMMTLQISAHLPGRGVTDLLVAPSLSEARSALDGDGESGFPGNASYAFGGAILLPYANRIRGTLSPNGKTIDAAIPGRRVTLPANWGGRRPGAERYAMHGLVLASRVEDVRRRTSDEEDRVSGVLHAGDFGGHWVSATEVAFENVLRSDSFTLTVTAHNAGSELLPMGRGAGGARASTATSPPTGDADDRLGPPPRPTPQDPLAAPAVRGEPRWAGARLPSAGAGCRRPR